MCLLLLCSGAPITQCVREFDWAPFFFLGIFSLTLPLMIHIWNEGVLLLAACLHCRMWVDSISIVHSLFMKQLHPYSERRVPYSEYGMELLHCNPTSTLFIRSFSEEASRSLDTRLNLEPARLVRPLPDHSLSYKQIIKP